MLLRHNVIASLAVRSDRLRSVPGCLSPATCFRPRQTCSGAKFLLVAAAARRAELESGMLTMQRPPSLFTVAAPTLGAQLRHVGNQR